MHRAAIATAVLVAATLAGTAEAATQSSYFNASKEFSVDRGNPNGVWSYGWMTADFATFTADTASYRDSSGVPVWYRTPASSDHTPCVWLNTTASKRYGAAPGQLVLHPSGSGEPSAVRWTAPAAGYYRIRGRFFPGDSGEMAVGVHRAGYPLLWSATDAGSFDLFDPNASPDVADRFFYMAGETVEFVVYGGYTSGSTPLEVEITRQTPVFPTYDATAEYGIYQGNPNGVWSYGWLSSNLVTFHRYDQYTHTTADALQWFSSTGAADRTPCIWRNDSTAAQYGTAPGQLALHPSQVGEASVLRWTAPSAGYYQVQAHFSPGDTGIMQVGVRATRFNQQGNLQSDWLWQATDSGAYDLRGIFFEAGQTLDFLVYGGYGNGNTPIDAVVRALPTWASYPPNPPWRFDARAQFSTNGNPSGVWSYGWMPVGFQSFSFYAGSTPESAVNPGSWWRSPPSSDFTPMIWHSNLGYVSHGVAPGELSLHPSSSGEASVLRFTAPSSGTYAFHARFFPGDVGLMSVGIRQGTSWLWTAIDSGATHLARTLNAGEPVDFAVYNRYTNGNTPLELLVTHGVSTPHVQAVTCSPRPTATGYYLKVTGTCDPWTGVGYDREEPHWSCSPDGTFEVGHAFQAGSSTLYLRGVEGARPQSPVVAFRATCP